MVAEWHYSKNGKQYGPVTAAELKALAQAGTLTPSDMVWKEGMAEWRTASSIKGLFQTDAASSAPLPAPAVSAPKPEPPSSAEASSPESAEAPDSLSFTDKVKSRLGRAIGPKGATKLAGAKAFVRQHRLWFGIGTGVAAVFLLILCLLPTGSGPGSKGYTQSILNLDPAKQKEYGIILPKKVKPLYSPGSAEDLVQSLSLFNYSGQAACWDTTPGHPGEMGGVNRSNGIQYSYQVTIPGGIYMKRECWDLLYGPQQDVKTVNESTGTDPRFGGGRTVSMNHWTLPCRNETVLLRGLSPKDVTHALTNAKKDEFVIQFVHFNNEYSDICPKKPEVSRSLFFKY